jgi:hypothetical protein
MSKLLLSLALTAFAWSGTAAACEYMDDTSAAAPAASSKMAAVSKQLPVATAPAPKALRTPDAKAATAPNTPIKASKPVEVARGTGSSGG